jgi:ATP-dependent Clp protease ATP-binding subunit ClpB
MDLDRYTQKAQKAIVDAQSLSEELNHSAIEPAHLLLSLIRQPQGVVPAIIERIVGSSDMLRAELEQELAFYKIDHKFGALSKPPQPLSQEAEV